MLDWRGRSVASRAVTHIMAVSRNVARIDVISGNVSAPAYALLECWVVMVTASADRRVQQHVVECLIVPFVTL